MAINRRGICSLIPAVLLSNAFAKDPALASSIFAFDDLHAKKLNDGAEVRSIVNGETPTGERVEIHETRLNPGGAPHPAHRHAHSEFWLVKEKASSARRE